MDNPIDRIMSADWLCEKCANSDPKYEDSIPMKIDQPHLTCERCYKKTDTLFQLRPSND